MGTTEDPIPYMTKIKLTYIPVQSWMKACLFQSIQCSVMRIHNYSKKCRYCGPTHLPDGALHMERHVPHAGRLTTVSSYAEMAGTKENTPLTHKWNSTKMKMRLRR